MRFTGWLRPGDESLLCGTGSDSTIIALQAQRAIAEHTTRRGSIWLINLDFMFTVGLATFRLLITSYMFLIFLSKQPLISLCTEKKEVCHSAECKHVKLIDFPQLYVKGFSLTILEHRKAFPRSNLNKLAFISSTYQWLAPLAYELSRRFMKPPIRPLHNWATKQQHSKQIISIQPHHQVECTIPH